ncbi:hypothetical protein NT05LI_1119, partial [Listeria ivanovii FSL F6-596]
GSNPVGTATKKNSSFTWILFFVAEIGQVFLFAL